MEKKYQLRAVKRGRSPEFLLLNASIFFDDRLIGKVKTCLNTNTTSVDFILAMDRIVFENFIVQWWKKEGWKKEDLSRISGLRELATKIQAPQLALPVSTMMCSWVRFITHSRAS